MNLLLRPGTLIDCTGAEGLRKTEILVQDGRIRAVGPAGSIPFDRASTRLIEELDCTLLPGLIDLHMHVFQWGQSHKIPWQKESILEAGVRGVGNASTLLDMGVTTARDVSSRDNLDIQLRDLIRAGVVRGPRFLSSGTHLEAVGRAAYFFPAIGISGPEEARAAARQQLRAGSDWIKIMATAGLGGGTGQLISEPGWQELSEEEIRAAADEAHHAGRKITAHAIGNEGIKAAIRAGIDCIEHGNYLDDEAIQLMVDHHVAYVPTLLITKNLGEHGAERGFEANIIERSKRTLSAGFESTRKAQRAGVRVATGSDVDFDETVSQEMRMLQEAGLTPMESLLAATRVAASIIDLDKELGTIEVGKVADLILVEGNPLQDAFALDKVRYVIQAGELVKQPAVREHASTAHLVGSAL